MTIEEMYQEMQEQTDEDVSYDDACLVSVEIDYTTQS